MTGKLEIIANAVNATSILIAGRNSVHTWWTGIIGCVLFGWMFIAAQLYADATLQVFFIATSVIGWLRWNRGDDGRCMPIRRTRPGSLVWMIVASVVVAAVYGWLLHRFTNAYAPFFDSLVLTFSVIAQLMLMSRRIETWWGWLIVNTIAVPLYFSRGLNVTAGLYAAFWVNAVFSLRHWRRLMPQ